MENQEIEQAMVKNPLLESEPTEATLPPKTKKTDKRLFYLGGLLAMLFFLTILSIVVSVVNRPKIKLVSTPESPTPTPQIQINNPELPPAWQEKFKPINNSLDTISNLLGKDEFLPPTLDLELGKN